MLPALVDLVARNSLRLREVILYGELMVGEEGSGICRACVSAKI